MRLALVLAALLFLSSCKSADIAQMESLGSKHRVTMYGCDGKIIGQWESEGNVSNEGNSDGWYFKDTKTGKLIELTGFLVIEQE